MVFAFVVGILLHALAIWIVDKLGLGLKVNGFVPALNAVLVISVGSALILWLLGLIGLSLGGFIRAVIHLIIAALVLMFAGNVVKGLKVKGFVPSLIAAVAIGLVSWLINGVIGLRF